MNSTGEKEPKTFTIEIIETCHKRIDIAAFSRQATIQEARKGHKTNSRLSKIDIGINLDFPFNLLTCKSNNCSLFSNVLILIKTPLCLPFSMKNIGSSNSLANLEIVK